MPCLFTQMGTMELSKEGCAARADPLMAEIVAMRNWPSGTVDRDAAVSAGSTSLRRVLGKRPRR
jgi:hypothetical protein